MKTRNRVTSISAAIAVIALALMTGMAKDRPPHWPMFRKVMIDTGANESAAVADVNQDGRLDIIAGENWFEAPDWKKHHMREIPFFEGYIDDLSNFALDVNGDSYPDVIASSWFSKKLAWYENPRRHDGDHANQLWKEHVIEEGFNYELILLADVDGDGKAEEIVPNYGSSGEVVWFERAKPYVDGKWIRHAAGRVPGVNGQHGVGVGDLNKDGRPDLITPFGWFEAPGDPRSDNWTFHNDFRLLPQKGGCSPIYVYDVNGDGRPDLIYGAGHDYGLYWLENKGNLQWEEHLIDNSWSQAHPITLIDLDGDGRMDIVTGKRYLAHEADPGAYEPLGIYWYRLEEGGHYSKHVIDFNSRAGGGIQIPVVDINGDGKLDLVTPGKSGLFLFEQVEFPRQKPN
jgi:hypothetical protein